jgi:hypothetical protein
MMLLTITGQATIAAAAGRKKHAVHCWQIWQGRVMMTPASCACCALTLRGGAWQLASSEPLLLFFWAPTCAAPGA